MTVWILRVTNWEGWDFRGLLRGAHESEAAVTYARSLWKSLVLIFFWASNSQYSRSYVDLKIAAVHLRRGSYHEKWAKTWFGTKPCTKTGQIDGGMCGCFTVGDKLFLQTRDPMFPEPRKTLILNRDSRPLSWKTLSSPIVSPAHSQSARCLWPVFVQGFVPNQVFAHFP